MRKAFVPEYWLTSGVNGETLRTLIAIALHADKNGVAFVKNGVLVQLLGKNDRQIQKDILLGESQGLISRGFNDAGKRFFRIENPQDTGRTVTTGGALPGRGVSPQDGGRTVTTGEGRTVTTGEGALSRRGGAHSQCAPPNNPHIGTPYSSTVLSHCIPACESVPASETPPAPDIEIQTEVFETSLPRSKPKTEIPEEIQRMSSEIGLESWIGELQYQGESLTDWRVKETLGRIFAKGEKKGSRYAWSIFRNLPENQPEPSEISSNSKVPDKEKEARNIARLEALR